jgi:hypothetical protein
LNFFDLHFAHSIHGIQNFCSKLRWLLGRLIKWSLTQTKESQRNCYSFHILQKEERERERDRERKRERARERKKEEKERGREIGYEVFYEALDLIFLEFNCDFKFTVNPLARTFRPPTQRHNR